MVLTGLSETHSVINQLEFNQLVGRSSKTQGTHMVLDTTLLVFISVRGRELNAQQITITQTVTKIKVIASTFNLLEVGREGISGNS